MRNEIRDKRKKNSPDLRGKFNGLILIVVRVDICSAVENKIRNVGRQHRYQEGLYDQTQLRSRWKSRTQHHVDQKGNIYSIYKKKYNWYRSNCSARLVPFRIRIVRWIYYVQRNVRLVEYFDWTELSRSSRHRLFPALSYRGRPAWEGGDPPRVRPKSKSSDRSFRFDRKHTAIGNDQYVSRCRYCNYYFAVLEQRTSQRRTERDRRHVHHTVGQPSWRRSVHMHGLQQRRTTRWTDHHRQYLVWVRFSV